jgi:molecular chaperone GrpE
LNDYIFIRAAFNIVFECGSSDQVIKDIMGFKDKKNADKSAETAASDSQSSQPRDADFSSYDETEEAAPADAMAGGSAGESDQIQKLKAEVEENKDKYLRALAEMENFKKRTLKERSEMLKYQGERILYDLLEVLDNLEWAISHSSADADKLKAGLELTHKLFVDALGRWEIRGVSAVGKEFDPVQHQAISKIAVDDTKPGTVINEFKKAYFYKDKLLRPGDVVVAVGRDGAEAGNSDEKGDSAAESEGDETETLK